MQSTSNSSSWNPHERPALRVTDAGMKLLAYLDYVNANYFVSLMPTDTAVPEQYDLDRDIPERQDVTPHVDEWQPEDMDDDDDDYGDHSPEED